MGVLNIAYFISPHGFGHAARSCAIINEMVQLLPDVKFNIFTTVPKWFFEQSLSQSFSYNECAVDIGLVQKTPLHSDLGVPYGYICRDNFRESPILAQYIESHMSGIRILEEELVSTGLENKIRALLTLTRISRSHDLNGGFKVAEFICSKL